MKILICDDNEDILEELKREVIRIISSCFGKQTIIVDTFCDAMGLYDYIYDSKIVPDAVIMDTCLGYGKYNNGIDVAKKLRNEYKNLNIIFCTENTDSLADVFEVEPLYVLFKPLDYNKLTDAIKKLYNYIMYNRNRCVSIKAIKGIRRVIVGNIDYLESQGRYVKIYVDGEEIVTINKLENLLEILGTEFIQCHKSYAVNYNSIEIYEDGQITLFDGTNIQVSRNYRKDIKENLLNRI